MTELTDAYRAIQLKSREIRRSEGFAAAIRFVESTIKKTADQETRQLLLADLSHYQVAAGQLAKAEKTIRRGIAEQPDDPSCWKRLAQYYLSHGANPAKAEKAIETALEKAESRGSMIRDVLATRIEIALERQDYRVVEDSLKRMLSAPYGPDEEYIHLDDHFLNRIPPDKVDEALLEQYRAAFPLLPGIAGSADEAG